MKAFASLLLIKRLEPLISILQLMKLRASSLITINEGSRLSLIIINEEANKRLEPVILLLELMKARASLL
jgi:hypothetical protein